MATSGVLKRGVAGALILLVLTGCGSQGSQPVDTPHASPSPNDARVQATWLAETQIHAIPSPSIQANESQTEPPTLPVLTIAPGTLQMHTATEGWCLGTIGIGGQPRVLRTEDAGRTWLDVSPRGVDLGEDPARIELSSLDAYTAWLTLQGPPQDPDYTFSASVVAVYGTTDGGATWTTGYPFSIQSGAPVDTFFVDSTHGWMLITLVEFHSDNAVEIRRTKDGGVTWELASRTEPFTDDEDYPDTPKGMPVECTKEGLAFVDRTAGWVAGGCPVERLYLYATADAGTTWGPRLRLPVPEGLPAGVFDLYYSRTGTPVFFPGREGYMQVTLELDVGTMNILYATTNGGVDWVARALPDGAWLIGFSDPGHGWSYASGDDLLYATEDGGATWASIGVYPQATALGLGDMLFADADRGWITRGQRIDATEDGGRTWQSFPPLLASLLPMSQAATPLPTRTPQPSLIAPPVEAQWPPVTPIPTSSLPGSASAIAVCASSAKELPAIFLVDATGRQAVNLTGPDEWTDHLPRWSPDGTRIAFYSIAPDSKGHRIQVINVDGKGLTDLSAALRLPADGPLPFPVWSPDGSRIVFLADLPAGRALAVSSADGTGGRAVVFDPSAYDPVWSADGEQVYYVSETTGAPSLYSIRLENGIPSKLMDLPSDGKLIWSPDRSHFVQEDGGSGFMIADLADGSQTRVDDPGRRSGHHNYEFAWAPDGDRIAFDVTPGPYRRPLYVVDADGGNLRALAGDARYGVGSEFAWSPTGEEIAYVGVDPDLPAQDLFIVDVADNVVRRVPDVGAVVVSPYWSSDGTRLAFVAPAQGSIRERYTLFVIELARSESLAVFEADTICGVKWSPAR